MRLVGCQRWLIIGAFVGALSGCFLNATPQTRAEDVCTAYCQCYAPSQLDQCIQQDCLPDIPAVTDACLECVQLNSQTCSELASECTDLCLDPTP
jgi:hypothetical protein